MKGNNNKEKKINMFFVILITFTVAIYVLIIMLIYLSHKSTEDKNALLNNTLSWMDDWIWSIKKQNELNWNQEQTIENNVSNILLYWKKNEDYFTIVPEPQPSINKSTSSGNNNLIRSYNSKYICEFTIPSNKSAGYLLITLTSWAKIDIWNWRWIYLAIQWTTIWMITSDFVQYWENQYLYDITHLTFSTSKYNRNLFDKIVNNKLELSACVVSDKSDIKIEELTLILYNPVAYKED